MKRLLLALVFLLAGCATTKEVVVAVDNWCLTAKKRTWGVEDSPQSIQEARSWNEAIDRRCSAKKVAASK